MKPIECGGWVPPVGVGVGVGVGLGLGLGVAVGLGDGDGDGGGLDAVPVHATPLSAKPVGRGNGFGGAVSLAERVQLPCRPTLVLVWPVPIGPFHPMSVAVIDVVPV